MCGTSGHTPRHRPMVPFCLTVLLIHTLSVHGWTGLHFSSGPAPALSTKPPADLGFPVITRSGAIQPPNELLCLPDSSSHSGFWGTLGGSGGSSSKSNHPIHTNTWWMPAIAPLSVEGPFPTHRRVTTIPYVLGLEPLGVRVSYPHLIASLGDIVTTIVEPPDMDWIFSVASSSVLLHGHCLREAGKLYAKFLYRDMQTKREVMEILAVRGSAYATARYTKAAPQISSKQDLLQLTVDGIEATSYCDGQSGIIGRRFALSTADSDSQWVVYVPPNTALVCEPSPIRLYGITDDFSGIVRVAILNNCTTGNDSPKTGEPAPSCAGSGIANGNLQPYIDALDASANTLVTAATVTISSTHKVLSTTIDWKIEPAWPNTSNPNPAAEIASLPPALMVALPHHMGQLQFGNFTVIEQLKAQGKKYKGPAFVEAVGCGGHRSLTGYASPVKGNKWTLNLPKRPLPWTGSPDRAKKEAIRAALVADAASELPVQVARGMVDPYTAGRVLARVAQQVLVAEQLQETGIMQRLLGQLRDGLSVWLDHKSENPLFFDQSWGGIVSCGCVYLPQPPHCSNMVSKTDCPAMDNFDSARMEFGNPFYCGHHFHYGYLIYAAAVVAKLDKTWGAAYHDRVLVLVRDIANPSSDDPFFPPMRHFDWFVGHSWSSGGVMDSPNGLNQESASEAIGAYYGIFLYAIARAMPGLALAAEAVVLQEAEAVQTYWQIHRPGEIYPVAYKHSLVGILWDRMVEYQSYFGKQPFFVIGTQVRPVSPVVPVYLRDKQWLKTAISEFGQSCAASQLCPESGFVVLLFVMQALLDKEGAWSKALTLPDSSFAVTCAGCSGNSRTNTLHFIASVGNAAPTATIEMPWWMWVLVWIQENWLLIGAVVGALAAAGVGVAGGRTLWHQIQRFRLGYKSVVDNSGGSPTAGELQL